MKRHIQLAIITITTLLTVACGFHFRSAKDWPASLDKLNVSGIENPFMGQIKNLLSTLNVKVVGKTPYQLIISNYQDSLENNQNNQSLDTTQPSLSSYNISFTAQLLKNKKVVSSHAFSSSISSINNNDANISLRPSQIQISLVKENLLQELYFWLKSTQIHSS